ncbi:DUF222 domain-containing protein [Georgenia phoenicis]|uniref:HNH endonuclease signature motif containing protein n=1 Tax=unclassified Georgenia TaxID=2626815 RepID=UPI0039B0971E
MTTSESPAPALLADTVRRSVSALRDSAPGGAAGSWANETRESVIASLDAAIQELTVYRGQVLLAHREQGRWASVRDRDFADWRSRKTGTGRGSAVGDVQLAQGLAEMPAVAEAVERGELNLEHARTLTRLRDKASTEVQAALDAGGLDDLVTRATRGQLSAPELAKQARAWSATIDSAAAQAEFDAARRRRSLTMRKHAGGVAGEFFLDAVAGEELRTALEAIVGRPAADDDRTREQRMADALTTMAGRTLQVGSALVGAQVRPHLSLIVTEETWVGVLARRRRFEACPDQPRPAWPQVPPAQLEDGTVVPLGELERLMCDSEFTRMVMNAKGVPLDVGRTQRTYTKELRRAIMTRDRRCQWPGCRLRASWSEVHHITWFSRGGSTSLTEGICLCSYHHHLVHQIDVRITPRPDGFDFHRPNGTHIGTTFRDTEGTRLPDPSTVPHQLADRSVGRAELSRPSGSERSAKSEVTVPPTPARTTGQRAGSSGAPAPTRSPGTAPATLWGSEPPF